MTDEEALKQAHEASPLLGSHVAKLLTRCADLQEDLEEEVRQNEHLQEQLDRQQTAFLKDDEQLLRAVERLIEAHKDVEADKHWRAVDARAGVDTAGLPPPVDVSLVLADAERALRNFYASTY